MFPKTAARSALVSFSFMIAASLFPAAAQTLPVKTQVPSRIVSPVDESVRVTIPRSTHPLAKPAFDIGPMDGSAALKRLILVLGASPDQEHAARTLLDSQQTKGSPDYHHWLTPEEFGQKFGPSAQDIKQVTGWLQQHGFTVGSIAKSGRWIEFSGTSAQVEAAFQTHMRQYQIAGAMHIANSADISVPAALSPVVKGVASLHDFFSKPMISHMHGVQRNAQGELVRTNNPDFTTGKGNHFLTPSDFATIYDLNPLLGTFNGTGQTIAIVARSNIDPNDVSTFRQTFGLAPNTTTVILNGPDPGDVPNDDIEAILDTEWSGAVAPGATIDVVVSASTLSSDGVDLSASFIVDNNLAPIMSVSFGECEAGLGGVGSPENIFLNGLWQQAAAQGISVFVSAGDNGAAGCDDPNDPNNVPASGGLAVSGLASTPFNTAVGGTEFNETGAGENPSPGTTGATFWNASNGSGFASAKGYIPEMVWNESCDPTTPMSPCAQQGFNLFAGSGGASSLYSKPSWQMTSILGVPNDSKRDLPDVSLTAAIHDGFLICFQEDPTVACQVSNGALVQAAVVGGTSASSPSFAGIMAIVDQKMATTQPTTAGRQGLANYVLYSLANTQGNFSNCNSNSRTNPATGTSCIFNDVTTGNNSVPGQVGFNAGAGFDLASGLGSIDGNNLVTAWANSTFKGSTATLTVTNPTPSGGMFSITHGQPVSVTIGVASMTTGTPTGNVALITNASGSGGNGTIAVGAGSLTSGSFSGSFSNLPGGTYNLSARYPGDGVFAASDSTPTIAHVTPENSTVSLNAVVLNVNGLTPPPLTAVPYGDANNIIVFDSIVAGNSGNGFPSGNVTFKDGSTIIANIVNLNNRADAEVADCFTPIACLTIGTHSITTSYNGDSSFNSSGPSNTVSITIVKGNPTSLLLAPPVAGAGVAFTLQALVGTGLGTITPTGSLTFLDGTTALGVVSVMPSGVQGQGQASLQVTLNAAGAHNITAQYSGDSTYNAAASVASIVTVSAPFNFASTTTSQTIAAGGTATYNVTLNGVGGFSGQVSFACTGAPGGANCAVSPNPATLNSTTTSVALTVTVSNTANARLAPHPLRSLPFVFAGIFVAGFLGLRRRPRERLFLFLGILVMAGVTSCGGGGGSTPTPRAPTNATLTVTGTSGSTTNSVTLTLTVTH